MTRYVTPQEAARMGYVDALARQGDSARALRVIRGTERNSRIAITPVIKDFLDSYARRLKLNYTEANSK